MTLSNHLNNMANNPSSTFVPVGTGYLTPELLAMVAAQRGEVILVPEAKTRMERARQAVEQAVRAGKARYGINTGFGALAEVTVSEDELAKLQLNLIRSHSCGVGAWYPVQVVRGMLLLRAQVLALGYSGVRPELVELILQMLNRGVHPMVPCRGSVGASGDLAPLAHLAQVMIGEGKAQLGQGEILDGRVALERAGLTPIVLEPKEGLALINGTQAMTADGSLTLLKAEHLCKMADIAAAMTIEALMGSHRPADNRLAALRPHPGHGVSAANLRMLLTGSEINQAHTQCTRVQDAYSCRCTPQVHGATRDALTYVRTVLSTEINSVTDNPLIFPVGDGNIRDSDSDSDDYSGNDSQGINVEIISGGNFHGQPVAIAMDLLSIAVAELANISDRRVDQLLNPASNYGLPAFLASRPGVESGFMIAQVAGASLVSENKVLAHPSSVDSITTSAGREDHVSMGTYGAAKARDIVGNVETVLAIEIMTAARGLDLRFPRKPGLGVAAAHQAVRRVVPPIDGDRALHQDIIAVTALLNNNDNSGLLEAVEAAIGLPLR